ncbi:unnamed protein product [Prorocentrum cordatum]|uniref:Cytochrome b561 domain-containing protein n=1 Tax=Prorocentrum cordatum TaxID=2364126 RepID=A0ABN9VA47_9DINO|nr:unnamed protein product [Polarella glacialis]
MAMTVGAALATPRALAIPRPAAAKWASGAGAPAAPCGLGAAARGRGRSRRCPAGALRRARGRAPGQLPSTPLHRALRVVAPAAAAAVAAVLACTSPLPRPWLRPSAAHTAEHWLVWLSASAALQCAAVSLAAAAATQGLHHRRRLVLFWAHGALAAASLGPLIYGAARGLPLADAGPRTVAMAAVLFTAWACANGSGAIFGPRGYPAPVKWYLTRHFGSPVRGKALLIKYHKTVGALAYALTTLAAVLLLLSGAGAAAPAGPRAAACCALALTLAAAAALGPSALRRRFGLPQVQLARGDSGVPRLEVVL